MNSIWVIESKPKARKTWSFSSCEGANEEDAKRTAERRNAKDLFGWEYRAVEYIRKEPK